MAPYAASVSPTASRPAPERWRRAHAGDQRLGAEVTLFGLASLMLRTMEESAGLGLESHGGPIWKAFGRALWTEAEQRRQGRP